jgi:hypothetical protein
LLINPLTTGNIGSRLKCGKLASNCAGEYDMYFDYNGWTGGHDVVGF